MSAHTHTRDGKQTSYLTNTHTPARLTYKLSADVQACQRRGFRDTHQVTVPLRVLIHAQELGLMGMDAFRTAHEAGVIPEAGGRKG